MLASMPATLWGRWQRYFLAEPFGPRQDDLRAGVVAAILANQWRKEGSELAKPGDFFPSLKVKKRVDFWSTPEGQDLIARQMAIASGGKVIERA